MLSLKDLQGRGQSGDWMVGTIGLDSWHRRVGWWAQQGWMVGTAGLDDGHGGFVWWA